MRVLKFGRQSNGTILTREAVEQALKKPVIGATFHHRDREGVWYRAVVRFDSDGIRVIGKVGDDKRD